MYPNNAEGYTTMSAFKRAMYCAPKAGILPVMTLLLVFGASMYERLGTNLQLITFFMALARCMDILADPLVSHFSDTFRGVFGRRRPFFFAGSWLYVMMLLMVVSPPNMTPASLAVWFGCTYTGFFVLESFTVLPYKALGPELASTYDDRTTLYYVGSVFEIAGGIATVALSQLSTSGGASGSGDEATVCGYHRCYSDDGIGRSGRHDPLTSDYRYYDIFDVLIGSYGNSICTASDGTSYASYQDVFTNNGVSGPEVCAQPYYSSGTATNTYIYESPGINSDYLAALSSDASSSTLYNWYDRRAACLHTYCRCIWESSSLCSNASFQKQYQYSGYMIGLWVVGTMALVGLFFKERCQLLEAHRKLQPPMSTVPSLLSFTRNKAFMSLLPAFVCDHLSYTTITTLLLYWVRLVIQPEFQSKADGHTVECNNGRKLSNLDNDNDDVGYSDDALRWRCDSTYVMGAILLCMSFSALVTGPFWYAAAIKYGKRATYLASSGMLFASIFLLLAVDKGDVNLAIWLSAIPGAVLGNFFLSDAILADIIDYEECVHP